MSRTFFDRYPQLETLRALAPDALIERELGSRADEFERDAERARKLIPTVNLNRVFPAELERGAIRLENFLGHWGNISIEELCKICLIVRFLRPRNILELGTYNGMTTLQMALNAPAETTVYTLDLPEDADTEYELTEIDRLVSAHFKERFDTSTGSYFKGRDDVNVVQLWADTAKFDYTSIDGPLDLIFIDAAHDYENKRIDSENAFRLLAPGGVVMWHNYNDVVCPDVTKYLADIASERSLFHLRNTMLAVYRDQ